MFPSRKDKSVGREGATQICFHFFSNSLSFLQNIENVIISPVWPLKVSYSHLSHLMRLQGKHLFGGTANI